MKIIEVKEDYRDLYVKTLRHLIHSTINLPQEALSYFSDPWTADKVKSSKDWVFLLALDENKPSGVILGTPVEGGVGTIIWVLVDNTNQKKGIGTALFHEACKLYKEKKAHKVKLTVPNRRTVEFYEKVGMVLEGEHKNHWWGNDFWSMGLQL
ncbi:GNAT family N-acetyltransferase [Hyphobacterium sp. CCMP332]|nr:GNAT family N-acetyltransferase [Hyphobacterium sp. CCMP332]